MYKQFVRPVLGYATPAWTSDLAPTHLKKLQRTQNAALRIATGCVQSTPTLHLHDECKVLPLKDHWDMRGTQFLAAAASQPDHPMRSLLNPLRTRRSHHVTPAALYGSLRDSIPPSPPAPPPPPSEKAHIHTHFVETFLARARPKSLLHPNPLPPIAAEESELPRRDRVHLSRLRSGLHPALLSYECILRPDVDPACRWCGEAPEEITHILERCPGTQDARRRFGVTSPSDLWTRPIPTLACRREVGLIQDPPRYRSLTKHQHTRGAPGRSWSPPCLDGRQGWGGAMQQQQRLYRSAPNLS